MSEDQGGTKGQDNSDAPVKADAAIPAKPAALSDKDLDKVAGGASYPTYTNGPMVFRAPNTFTK